MTEFGIPEPNGVLTVKQSAFTSEGNWARSRREEESTSKSNDILDDDGAVFSSIKVGQAHLVRNSSLQLFQTLPLCSPTVTLSKRLLFV